MRKSSISGLAIALVVAAAAAFWTLNRAADEPGSGSAATRAAAEPARLPPAALVTENDPASLRAMADPPTRERPLPLGETAPPGQVFRVDDNGALVLDEQTRLDVEALFARTEHRDLARMKQRETQGLPPVAAAQALDLLERYDNYQQAQRQTYPPGVEPPTEEAALAELEGLHTLRIAHFGPQLTQALYGAEEQLSRSLIRLMQLDKDESLTLEEKAIRAQQLRDSLPQFREQSAQE